MKHNFKWFIYRIKRRIDTWLCSDNPKYSMKENKDERDNNSDNRWEITNHRFGK